MYGIEKLGGTNFAK
jgi:hypothetical protein